MINMFFKKGNKFFSIAGSGDLVLDFCEGKKFFTHQLAQFFCELFLTFRKDAMKRHSQKLLRLARMKKHFNGYPICEPSDECRNDRYSYKPNIHVEIV